VDFLEERQKGLGLKFAKELKRALTADETLAPRIADLELRGRGGANRAASLAGAHRFSFQPGRSEAPVKLPATWLSQGYQSTISMIADILGHAFWDSGKQVKCADVRALVLIDEIDLHLHPSWQRQFVQALRSTFPKVQFVVTTHSPLILTGLEPGEVAVLSFDAQGNVAAQLPDEDPATLTGSQLFSYYFGVDRAAPDDVIDDLVAYMALDEADEAGQSKLADRLRRHYQEPSLLPELKQRIEGLGIGVPTE
jgi:hypothetical protein